MKSRTEGAKSGHLKSSSDDVTPCSLTGNRLISLTPVLQNQQLPSIVGMEQQSYTRGPRSCYECDRTVESTAVTAGFMVVLIVQTRRNTSTFFQ